jgi:hypothetical protein
MVTKTFREWSQRHSHNGDKDIHTMVVKHFSKMVLKIFLKIGVIRHSQYNVNYILIDISEIVLKPK